MPHRAALVGRHSELERLQDALDRARRRSGSLLMLARAAPGGRASELERLGDARARARRASGSLLMLAGEAGVGKTRLCEALAEDSGAVVLAGRARHGAKAPYGPVVAALRSFLRVQP